MSFRRWKPCSHPQRERRYIDTLYCVGIETHVFLCGACGDHFRETEVLPYRCEASA